MAILPFPWPTDLEFLYQIRTAMNGPGFISNLLHRTNDLPQKLVVKLDTNLFSHFVSILEILQTLCAFCESEVSRPQPGAPPSDWFCMGAEVPACPGPPPPC